MFRRKGKESVKPVNTPTVVSETDQVTRFISRAWQRAVLNALTDQAVQKELAQHPLKGDTFFRTATGEEVYFSFLVKKVAVPTPGITVEALPAEGTDEATLTAEDRETASPTPPPLPPRPTGSIRRQDREAEALRLEKEAAKKEAQSSCFSCFSFNKAR